MNLANSAALVTGGASGLGFAVAKRFCGAGARVVVLDLPSSSSVQTLEELGPEAYIVHGDVTDPGAVSDALDVAEEHGPLRVAVNCAGVGTPARLLGRDGAPASPAGFERVLAVNVFGTFNVLRLAAARMTRSPLVDDERGVIINTASIAAFEGQVGQVAYAASKAAVVGMTLPSARELAEHQIRVVSVAPGLFRTPMLLGLPEHALEGLAQQVPHPSRLGRPDEYAALVQAIVENPMVNGETIRIDGGIRMASR